MEEDKAALRQRMRERLNEHARSLNAQGWRGWCARFRQDFAERRLANRLAELLAQSSPKVLAAYYPMKGELDPLPFLRRMHAKGWPITLPCISEDESNRHMRFCRWAPGEPTEKNRLGIHEPAAKIPMVPQVLLIPLVAFDRHAERLGYGKGFYDTTLNALAADGQPRILLGIGHDFQEVETVPTEAHDVALTAIVTPRRVLARSLPVIQS